MPNLMTNTELDEFEQMKMDMGQQRRLMGQINMSGAQQVDMRIRSVQNQRLA